MLLDGLLAEEDLHTVDRVTAPFNAIRPSESCLGSKLICTIPEQRKHAQARYHELASAPG